MGFPLDPLPFSSWETSTNFLESTFGESRSSLYNFLSLSLTPAINRFTDWAKQYGGIFSVRYVYLTSAFGCSLLCRSQLKIAHGTMVVITSPRIINDYMEKRCKFTSDRPPMKVVDIITNGLHPALTSGTFISPTERLSEADTGIGQMFKTMRRAMQLFLTKEMCSKHLPIQNAECAQFLYDILKLPKVGTVPLGKALTFHTSIS